MPTWFSIWKTAGYFNMNEQTAIFAEKLSYKYAPAGFQKVPAGKIAPAIRDVDIVLKTGEIVALRGPNGSGKTTLGKLLTGILTPGSGQVVIFGKNANSMKLHEIGRRIGYCFQNPEKQLFTSSVEEEISLGPRYNGVAESEIRSLVEDLLEELNLKKVRFSFPLNLSYGEKRRVALAAALALSPDYLILDEPTVGLDLNNLVILDRLLSNLKKLGKGMLIISHNREFLERITDRTLWMEKGRLADG